MTTPYLTAREAAGTLGVTLPTLYAYVSRGLIRSEETGDSRRARRYHAEDVRQLKARKEQRRHPGAVVQRALHWGEPVLESAITLIGDGRFYYRGRDAVTLAATRPAEAVAALIWTGDERASESLFTGPIGTLPPRCRAVREQLLDREPVAAFGALLEVAAGGDPAAYDTRPGAVAQTGARILRLLTAASGASPATRGIARALQEGWTPAEPRAEALLDAALILCADHELNVASFAARCVASAGATPYGVVIAGLAAARGAGHGGKIRKLEAFLRDAQALGTREAISAWLARGEEIAGFGHQLYPDGDPRATALLEMAGVAFPRSRALAFMRSVAQEVYAVLGELPSIDVGLVALAQALSLPPGSALTLFALGRTIGWIGHAIEQYEANWLIRPRARYSGVQPHHSAWPASAGSGRM
jgi:citrate synthase